MGSKQHIQVPNNMTTSGELSPKDLLVYTTIKSHMNKLTKSCFPSLSTIAKESGISRPTVIKSIESLKKSGYISVKIDGRKNVYTFSSYKNFEPFSMDFLKLEINANIKAFLIATQQFMFKDIKGFGKISYSDTELSKIINIDRHTIAKYSKELEEKGLLTTFKTNTRDPITGLQINEKLFHLDDLGQMIIWELINQKETIEDIKESSKTNSKDIGILKIEIERLKDKDEENKLLKEFITSIVSKEKVEEILNKDIII